MFSFGMKLWESIKSVLSAKRGYPYVSIQVPLPIRSPMKQTAPKSRWQYIVIHHSFSQDNATTRNWESIRKYHIETNGWKEIGYHWGLEMHSGKLDILPGRSMDTDGAHAIGFNRNGIGVCLVGNYDIEAPSESRLIKLTGLVSDLIQKHNIPIQNVIGHRETYLLRGVKVEKSCPGKMFDMDQFRTRLTTYRRNEQNT